ncbi:hypothetical protein L873DRAFT_45436 [Choiromyces venosus 120613-1]|uniref:Uncharacterized protein n=1 Tax=Choiromyces venosus 120613-1 TaxID=1336337 RepID=A0A3N4K088_9PEZI|nr:hypothetical protein L873DRAFT_45436 [Choiromyces venosus 120613-1]
MSGSSGRPSMAKAITKVQQVSDIIEGESIDRWNSDELDDSESNESSDESRYGKRKSKKGKKGNYHSTRGIRQGQGELKAEEETGKIRWELEELKYRITKNEQKEYGLAQTGLMGAQNLGRLPMEVFSIGNRLAQPQGYVTDHQGLRGVDHFEPRIYHLSHTCWSDQIAPQEQ